MRPIKLCLLATIVAVSTLFAGAQSNTPAGSATKQEVDQLRQEVAEQRQTIEQLKSLVQQLVDAKSQSASFTAPASGDNPQLLNATLQQSGGAGAQTPPAGGQAAQPAAKPAGPTAGWNGEHFFIKSPDGNFQIQPTGYFQSDYRAYHGDGAPSATFVIRRARFGFSGNYGKYYDFGVLLDAAAGNGLSLRDLFINIKPRPEFQFQVGQFKEPFAQDEMLGERPR